MTDRCEINHRKYDAIPVLPLQIPGLRFVYQALVLLPETHKVLGLDGAAAEKHKSYTKEKEFLNPAF